MTRIVIQFKCVDCNNINYLSSKNPKTSKDKLELKKYCKKCKKLILHKEIKPK